MFSGAAHASRPRAKPGKASRSTKRSLLPRWRNRFIPPDRFGPNVVYVSRVGRVRVGIKITVDSTGAVTQVDPSLVSFSTPTPSASEFEAAVEFAVRRWHFHPAETVCLEKRKMPDGSTYQRQPCVEATETSFEVSFTFTADGRVLGPP